VALYLPRLPKLPLFLKNLNILMQELTIYQKTLGWKLLPAIKKEVARQIVGGASDRTIRRVLQDPSYSTSYQQLIIAKIAIEIVTEHEQKITAKQPTVA
jgi:hypothetical protein